MEKWILVKNFALCLFFLICLFLFPLKNVFADPSGNQGPDWVGVETFVSHFQTEQGQSVVFPELMEEIGFHISPKWIVDFRRYSGSSSGANHLKASVGDVEGRLGYLLGDNHESSSGSSFFQNVYGWLSWKVWSSHIKFNNRKFYERDEGMGFGVMRFPLNRGLSYWYGLAIYPSVHENFKNDISSITAQAGGAYSLFSSLDLTVGYRVQTLLTDDRHGRAEEQGIILGLQGRF
jgi:hypothetical protein